MRNIVVVPYDQKWPVQFAVESKRLSEVFASLVVDIHHIGSTSVSVLDTPIWMVHGDSDGVVNPDTSRDTYRVLAGLETSDSINFTENLLGGPTAIAGNTRYTEIPGRGHSEWSTIYTSNTFYDWMFAQSTAIPEPSTLLLAVISSASLMLRRKSHSPRFF